MMSCPAPDQQPCLFVKWGVWYFFILPGIKLSGPLLHEKGIIPDEAATPTDPAPNNLKNVLRSIFSKSLVHFTKLPFLPQP